LLFLFKKTTTTLRGEIGTAPSKTEIDLSRAETNYSILGLEE